MLPKAMLIPHSTQYEIALCYNLECISFSSHPSLDESGNERDNRPGIELVFWWQMTRMP